MMNHVRQQVDLSEKKKHTTLCPLLWLIVPAQYAGSRLENLSEREEK